MSWMLLALLVFESASSTAWTVRVVESANKRENYPENKGSWCANSFYHIGSKLRRSITVHLNLIEIHGTGLVEENKIQKNHPPPLQCLPYHLIVP